MRETTTPLPPARHSKRLQALIADALRRDAVAEVARLAPVLAMVEHARATADAKRLEAHRIDIREAWAVRLPDGRVFYPQVQRRRTATHLAKVTKAVALGKYLPGAPHPWGLRPDLRQAFETLRVEGKREDLSAWRRWAYRWHEGWMPDFMVPKDSGGTRAKKPREDKSLVADDPGHILGLRSDLRQLFAAMTRRQQTAVMRLTAVATEGVPAWMVPTPPKPRGRPRKS